MYVCVCVCVCVCMHACMRACMWAQNMNSWMSSAMYRVRHKSVNTPVRHTSVNTPSSHERHVVRTWLAVYSGWG